MTSSVKKVTTCLVAFLLPSAGLVAQTGQTAPLTGKWVVELSVSGYSASQVCEFRQSGEELDGTCSSEEGKIQIQGRVEGKRVVWSFDSEGGGQKHRVTLKGTQESDSKIKGIVDVPYYGLEGEFVATRQP